MKELARTRRRNADKVDPGIGRTRLGQRIFECVVLIGTRSAQSIMASGFTAAQTGRTHDRTRPMLQLGQKVLAKAPSTHDPKRTFVCHFRYENTLELRINASDNLPPLCTAATGTRKRFTAAQQNVSENKRINLSSAQHDDACLGSQKDCNEELTANKLVGWMVGHGCNARLGVGRSNYRLPGRLRR